jgi:hypothetical protein
MTPERNYDPAMTTDAIRSEWTALRDRRDAGAIAMKESQAAVIELSHRYASLDAEEREVVDELLSEWVLSDEGQARPALCLLRVW